MTISVKQNNTYAAATGVWVKVNGVWKQVATSGLDGLGTWATLSRATGSPKRYTYTQSGTEWVAFEWTNTNGTHSVTTDGGLVDILMLGGAAANGTNEANSGGLHHGLSVLPNGPSDIVVGVQGTAGPGNAGGGKSVIGPYVAHGSGLAIAGNTVGVHGEKYIGGSDNHLKGIDIDFLGTGVLPYGYALTTDRRSNSGSSWDNAWGSAGVVCVRVPKDYDNIPSGDWVTRIDYYADVTDGIVTDTYQERFYGDDTVRTENGRYASPEQPDDLIPCDPSVAEGWTYADGEFTPPPPDPSWREEAIAALKQQLKDLQKDT